MRTIDEQIEDDLDFVVALEDVEAKVIDEMERDIRLRLDILCCLKSCTVRVRDRLKALIQKRDDENKVGTSTPSECKPVLQDGLPDAPPLQDKPIQWVDENRRAGTLDPKTLYYTRE